tara:strand:+ start:16080 stop:16769 length:690 start_codon:yes stop_codon:yes gene_type:complete
LTNKNDLLDLNQVKHQGGLLLLMTYAQLSVNAREIVAKFTLATSQEVQLGCDWYASAFQISCRIANKYGLRPEVAAGVIAALSPNNRWERNIIDAEAIIKCWAAGGTDEDILAVKVCTYTKMQEKALDILRWGHSIVEILNGPKIIEFFNCITNSALNDVCIDGHAYSVWFGQRLTMKQVPNIGKKLRQQIKDDYVDATSFINEELNESFTAADIQAITWVTHKRIHNV